jgi:SAM-dependent methyltransferase
MPTPRVPARVAWAVSQLSVDPADYLLEIGCGPGHAVRLICPLLTSGTITAIDRSSLQVSRARRGNARCIQAGRARIEQLALADAAAGLARGFDTVFAINVNAFWTEPAASLPALRRLTGTRGRAYLFYEPPSAAGARGLESRLVKLFPAEGVDVADVRRAALGVTRGLCLVLAPV